MNHEQASQFVRALFRLVWEKRDRKRVPQFYSEEVSGFRGLAPITITSIYRSLDQLDEYYATNEYTIHDLVVEGNRIAMVVNVKLRTLDGRFEQYNSFSNFVELEKGKIVKSRMFLEMGEARRLPPKNKKATLAAKVVNALLPSDKPNKAAAKHEPVDSKPIVDAPAQTAEKEEPQQAESPVPKQPEVAVESAQAASEPLSSAAASYDASPGATFTFGKASIEAEPKEKDA